jgi:DNA-binding response OmpR family regulator
MAELLLIEPDAVLARAYTIALQQDGHHVHWRTEAQSAVDILDTNNVDLVILELQLAAHNGVELIHELRSYPDWDNIPVLLHTMVPQDQAVLGEQFWPQLGIAGYLYKPHATLARLRRRVNQLLVTQPA